MRIATSTIYDNQTQSIDTLSAQYQNIGQQLSTGKSLNVPSDDPAQVSQDLTLTTTISAENSDASNASAAQNELTFTDATLSSVTTALQTARNLAVSGATDIIPNKAQRPLIGQQVAGILNQVLALANAQYGGTYLFAGSGSSTTPPVAPLGSPPNAIAFTGNNDTRTEVIDGQSVAVGTTLQAAFNQGSTNGTPSVFTLLATLRDTLDTETAATQSQRSVNVTGQVILGAGAATQTSLGTIAGPPAMTSIPLTADSTGKYSFAISGTNPATGANTSVGPPTFTFAAATPLDGPGGVIQAINAQTTTTGVTAAFNQQTQRITLTSTAPNSPAFAVDNAASAGATNTSNILEAFQIPTTGSVTTNLSTQIGDIDDVINQVLSARAGIGQQIQNLAGTTSQVQALAVDNTVTKSGYEDTNVAQATSQFTLTQTALQAAYATTTRLEGKSLIDYL